MDADSDLELVRLKREKPMSQNRDPDSILATLEGETRRIRLGVDRLVPLLAQFDSPQEDLSVVLVAGTNGKGSTASLLASMATAAGYRTGLFTSPHLEGVEERLRIDRKAISRADLGELLAEIIGLAEQQELELPTYFEAVTLAALLWFARSETQLAVLEVGMGGRLDATNAANPILSLVTEIDLDHQAQLGDTLAAIAREKAGIFRPQVAAITSAREPEAIESLRANALELKTPLTVLDSRLKRVETAESDEVQRVRLITRRDSYLLELHLLGEHQVRNLALAVVAAEDLVKQGWLRLDAEAIERGVRSCRWPGRLERVTLDTGKEIWLDGAHNAGAAESLALFLTSRWEAYDLLLAIRADKDAPTIARLLVGSAARVVLTRLPQEGSLDPESLRALVAVGQAEVVEDPAAAIESLLARPWSSSRPLVICGSLYLVGWARRWLRARYGRPSSAASV